LGNIPAQIAALRSMVVRELREKYREVFGEPTRSRNRIYLQKKVAWGIQARAEGGLSERARARIEELAADAPIRTRATREERSAIEAALGAVQKPDSKPRDPRLPAPGTVLRRIHQGVAHEVTVLEDGFKYQGKPYRSLSRVAREITGTQWNGWLFFGIARRGAKGTAR
jgi:hypothetical protein